MFVKDKNNLQEASISLLDFYERFCVQEGDKLLAGSKITIFRKKKISQELHIYPDQKLDQLVL